MKKIRLQSILTFLIATFSISLVEAQQWCNTSEVSIQSAEEDAFNAYVVNFNQNGGHLNTDIKTIPVVIHVVYNSATDSATMNFERVENAIDITNTYLRRQNPDTTNTHPDFAPVAKDMHIEVCLATRKPDGSIFNGVVYTSSFDNSQLFDVTKYLNIIVDPENTSANASTPWELTGSGIDGIFIGYDYFGYLDPGMDEAFNEGKVLAHETGHYLGLYHTFHNGLNYLGDCSVIYNDTIGDHCADTPLDWSFFPIPGDFCDIPMRYCDSGDSIRAQVENYMHYNRTECLNMFSNDQRTRMRACLDSARASLVSLENLIFTGVPCNLVSSSEYQSDENGFLLYPNPTHDMLYIENKTAEAIDKVSVYSQLGQLIYTSRPSEALKQIDLSRFESGVYFIKIETPNQNFVQKIIKQ